MDQAKQQRNQPTKRTRTVLSTRWTRSLVLYATTIVTPLATIGCGGSPAVQDTPSLPPPPPIDGELEGLPPPDGGIPQCEAYKDQKDIYGYCIYKFAGGFPNVQEVERLCPMAGSWEKECRHAWVSGRMNENSGIEMDFLLNVCGKNPDCTFELIDFRPNPDVVIQMNYCIQYVGPYVRDCVGHAMQRWWYSAPDAEEVARVASISSPFPDRIAFYVAASVACSNIGTCDGDNKMKSICLENVKNYKQYPNRCPAQEEKPMKGSLKPEELEGKTGQSKPKQPIQQQGPPLGVKPPHVQHDGKPLPQNQQ